MSQGLDEIVNEEKIEFMSVQELLALAVQDATTGESAVIVADEFFDEFVYRKREETSQILMMLDMPDDTIISAILQMQMQAFDVFKQNAPQYLSDLRKEVKSRFAEMQTQN